jgi:hypothetical protein
MTFHDYAKLKLEKDAMKHVMDNGRKGTLYHAQATERYNKTLKDIKKIFRIPKVS